MFSIARENVVFAFNGSPLRLNEFEKTTVHAILHVHYIIDI